MKYYHSQRTLGLAKLGQPTVALATAPAPAAVKEQRYADSQRAREMIIRAMHLDGIASHILSAARDEIKTAEKAGVYSPLRTCNLEFIEKLIEQEPKPGRWAVAYKESAMEAYRLLPYAKKEPIVARAEAEVKKAHSHLNNQ